MKNILIITQEYPPRTGGAGVVAYQNAEGLAALGHKVAVLTRQCGDCPKSSATIEVILVNGVKKLWPFFMARKLQTLNLDRFDSIILNDVGAAFVFATLLPSHKIHTRKCILYLHGGEVQTVLQSPKGYLRYSRFLRRYIRLVQACRCVIAVSHYMKDYFLDHFPAPLDEGRIAVVYAGVDDKRFRPVTTQVRQKIGITSDESMLITVGRIVKEKGFLNMLALYEKAWVQNPSLHWVIIGDGPYLEELKHESAKTTARKGIHFLGRIEREKLPQYCSAADLFWLLSERESFGLVYVEAQMCGCPAMGPAKYGVMEAIAHGTTGFLVSRDEECVYVLATGAFKRLNRENVAEVAGSFSLCSQVKVLESLL